MSKFNEVMHQSDIKHFESTPYLLFFIVKSLAIFYPLTFHAYLKFPHEYNIQCVQMNIGIANILEFYRGQYMNLIFGVCVLLSLPKVKSKQSLYLWLFFYHLWNILFCWNNDNLLQGILHNTISFYYMHCSNENDYKLCFRIWGLSRCLSISMTGLNRIISYINTLIYVQEYGGLCIFFSN